MDSRLHGLAEAAQAALPIKDCRDFVETCPYNLDAGCLRHLDEGQWAFLNRIRKGWHETGYYFSSCLSDGTENKYELRVPIAMLQCPWGTTVMSQATTRP